jgi:U3 small nucleolar RNA-associated protein 5
MSTKRKLPEKLGQPHIKQSAKVMGKGNLNESKTMVSSGGSAVKPDIKGSNPVVVISSDSSEEEGESEDSDGAEEQDGAEIGEDDVQMEDAGEGNNNPDDEGEEQEGAEPSFGDLVRASEPIDVAGAFSNADARALAYSQGKQIQPPSGASLGTVLSQALNTNDVALLESCLHTTDADTIRATIQRLDSPLAGTLLQRLAERLHRKPGRAGSLMVWVQWTLVTHGGYLATQPDLIKKLAQLNKVIDERAKGLQCLLSLKGKLDMLEAQIELRRRMQRHQNEDEDHDDGVIYVEGQESEEDVSKPQKLATNGHLEDGSDSEVSEDVPMTTGPIEDSEEEEDESSDEDGFLDDEAEETDADSDDGDEVDHEDQDSEGDEEESDDAQAPPSKLQRIGGMASRRR